jgi:hypothetical protein
MGYGDFTGEIDEGITVDLQIIISAKGLLDGCDPDE